MFKKNSTASAQSAKRCGLKASQTLQRTLMHTKVQTNFILYRK